MSSINPNNIDGTYPIAGQDNDSQGFRDNFTNLKNNLTFAKQEIEDLQNNAILKSALTGTSLNNNMNSALLIGPQIKDASEAFYDIGSSTGAVTVNYTNGHFQKITTTGSITLTFSNWPDSNQHGWVKLLISVASTAHTVTWPSAVSQGLNDIQGVNESTREMTVPTATNYLFELETVDNGTTIYISDLLRNRDVNTQSESAVFSDFLTVSNVSDVTLSGTTSAFSNLALSDAPVRFKGGAIFEKSAYGAVVIGNQIVPRGNVAPAIGIFRESANISVDGSSNVAISTNSASRWVFDYNGNLVTATNQVGAIGDGLRKPYSINAGTVLTTGGYFVAPGSEDLASGAAANVLLHTSYFTTGGAETATLAAGVEGQVKVFAMVATAGNMVITVTNAGWKATGTGTITFTAVGQACTLQYINSKWFVIGNNGPTFA